MADTTPEEMDRIGALVLEQSRVIIDAAIEEAMAGDRAAILDGLRPHMVLMRDWSAREVSVVPWSVILAVLTEENPDA
jgi:hypothetical protein